MFMVFLCLSEINVCKKYYLHSEFLIFAFLSLGLFRFQSHGTTGLEIKKNLQVTLEK